MYEQPSNPTLLIFDLAFLQDRALNATYATTKTAIMASASKRFALASQNRTDVSPSFDGAYSLIGVRCVPV